MEIRYRPSRPKTNSPIPTTKRRGRSVAPLCFFRTIDLFRYTIGRIGRCMARIDDDLAVQDHIVDTIGALLINPERRKLDRAHQKCSGRSVVRSTWAAPYDTEAAQ